MRDTIQAALTADATLTTTLPGGVHAEAQISRQLTPAAFDANGELQPCALVRIETTAQHGPFTGAVLSARTYILVYFYQRQGYANIDAALARVRALLHESRLGTRTWDIAWAFDSGDLVDEAMRCSLRFSRYVVTRRL
jgi:hypothetical protein